MELVDSHLDLTNSCMDSSVYSQSSQLLESRLSSGDMDKMQKDNLLLKLLELYEALQNTEKDNQRLRIEKAQLRTQLKNTKTRAQEFIQSNICAAQFMESKGSPQSGNKLIMTRSPTQSIQNCFMTPYDSEDQNDKVQKPNKVFVKTHSRGTSNNYGPDNNNMVEYQKHCHTLMSSPVKGHSIKVHNNNSKQQQRGRTKLDFPKNKINDLIVMEREYEQKNQCQVQNRTLDNFQSFYCPRKDDFAQTQRNSNFPLPKKTASPAQYPWQQAIIPHPQLNQHYEVSDSDRNTAKNLNRSLSSSTLSNRNYCNSRGFKIPSSIDQIWGPSNNASNQNFLQKVNASTNKTSKLSKVNGAKVALQRKSYLNC